MHEAGTCARELLFVGAHLSDIVPNLDHTILTNSDSVVLRLRADEVVDLTLLEAVDLLEVVLAVVHHPDLALTVLDVPFLVGEDHVHDVSGFAVLAGDLDLTGWLESDIDAFISLS